MAPTKSTGTKSEAKPKTGKAPAAKETKAAAPRKAEAPKAAAAPKAEVKKAPSPAADGKIKVTQLVGTIGRQRDQEATLIGLGLNKRHRSRVLENTPAVRGMVYKVRHLVKVEKVS
jgi:large subunit ribosomal protein L30